MVERLLISLLTGGHVLLEGVPGLGKTMLVRTIAEVIDCTFNRIQFTPDLMPADITGTNILVEEDGKLIGMITRDSADRLLAILVGLTAADRRRAASDR